MRFVIISFCLLIASCQPSGNTGKLAHSDHFIPTPEWIFSSENTLGQTATIVWRMDNKALIYDSRKAADQRTIEIYDPETKERRNLLDATKAVASLNALEADLMSTFQGPNLYSQKGDRGLYWFKDDIFVLDFTTSEFIRITNTDAKEKSANFSPDGTRIAFVRNNDLYVYDIPAKREYRITRTGSETLLNGTLSWVYWEEIFGRRDIGYWWSEDSKSIAFLETDESKVDLIHFVDHRTIAQTLIKQRYPKATGTNPTVRIGINRIGNRQIKWLDKRSFNYEYIIRVKWLPDSRRVSVQTMNRKQDVVDLYFVDTRSLKPTHILKETDPGWVNIHDDLYFFKDGKHFLWASERTGFAHLYLYDMSGKMVRQITRGEWATASSGAGLFWVRQAASAVDEENAYLYFTAMEKSSIERHLYRIGLDGQNMTRLTQEDGRHAISFSPNAKYYFSNYSRIDRSPEKAFFTANGKRLDLISPAQEELQKKLDLQYPELFTIKAQDGFELPAQLLKPKDFDPNRKYPLILKVYGGPSAPSVSNSWQFENLYNQNLLRAGYLVMSVDNRAATAISKTLENRFVAGSMRLNELPDIIDAVKYMKSQPYIDPDRVGMWGWSGGGTFTLTAMTHSTEFKAGISGAPNTDGRFYDTKWMEMYVKSFDRMEQTSLVKSAKNLHGKIMMMHGTYDDNVHIQHTYAVVDEFIKAGKLFEMMIYPMRKHGFRDRPALIHRYHTMIDFWKRNL